MRKSILLIFTACLLFIPTIHHLASITEPKSKQTRNIKTYLLNTFGILLISTWGAINWDYGQTSPKIKNEGWFNKNTKSLGADKLGHAYSTYLLAQVLTAYYKKIGYQENLTNLYGMSSSLFFMTFMEIGDSFSPHGLSYEDLLMNLLGAIASYTLILYPSIGDLIDFRLEYFNMDQWDIFTDYEEMKHSIVFKFDGIKSIQNRFLKYLEIHTGHSIYYDYLTKNYNKTVHIALSINLSSIFNKMSYKKTGTLLKYYTPPKSYFTIKKW